ncbi:MAG: hypothetical protein Nk1A_8960 [Endomicrobiia bacterium]|nr:MAG: hypothetical protein Nk1A_8960 [Endomicrobiia bacterium]
MIQYVDLVAANISSTSEGKTINNLLASYVRKDGTTPFMNQQKGITPVGDYDLATKRYVVETLEAYIKDADLDSFKFQVNTAISAKAKN